MSNRRYIIKREKGVDAHFKLVPAAWYEAVAGEILSRTYQRKPKILTFSKSKYAGLEKDVLKLFDELIDDLKRVFPATDEYKIRPEAIKHYYGYYDNQFYSRKEIFQKFGTANVRIPFLLSERDVSASSYPLSYYYDFERQHDKSLDFKAVIYRELLAMLFGKGKKSTFLAPILNRYEIAILCNREECKTDIRELGLSVRSFNCLYRSGITTTMQLLLMSESELHGVRNIKGKSVEEIEAIRNAILYKDSEPLVVQVRYKNQEATYTFKDVAGLQIVEKLFDALVNEILQAENNTLFDYFLSLGLENFLLLKGYLLMSDIVENSQLLQEELCCINFKEYAVELEAVTKAILEYEKQKEESLIEVMIVSDSIWGEIMKCCPEGSCPISRLRAFFEERIETIRDVFNCGEAYIEKLRYYDFVLLDAEIPYTVKVDDNGFLIYELDYEKASEEEKERLEGLPIELPIATHIPKEIEYLDYDDEETLKSILEEAEWELYILSTFLDENDSILIEIDEPEYDEDEFEEYDDVTFEEYEFTEIEEDEYWEMGKEYDE